MATRELYKHLPKQRTLPQDLMSNVKEAITLKENRKHLQQKIEASSGKNFALKDISNLQQYSKVSFLGSEIKKHRRIVKTTSRISYGDFGRSGQKLLRNIFPGCTNAKGL